MDTVNPIDARSSVTIVVYADEVPECFPKEAQHPGGMSDLDYRVFTTSDDFLEALVSTSTDMALVSTSKPKWRQTVADISSIRTDLPIYLIGDAQNSYVDGFRVVDVGAQRPESLSILIGSALEMKKLRSAFRTEKEELIKQLMDLRDEQERIESQAADIVEMAEDLEYSRESLERLNAEKDKLFSVIAHDLKSPFTSILGYTELLASTPDTLSPSQIKQYAENAHTAASNVFRMMQTLLEWARVQIGRVDYDPERLNLREVTAELVSVYANIAKRKSIAVNQPEHDAWVFADRGMTETVLRNLLNNAIKFTDHGGEIDLIYEQEGPEIIVTVRDTGVGMSSGQLDKFNKQLLLDGTAGTDGESGTGLGLSISREMIEKNGGRLTVESREGEGTSFSFNLERAETGKMDNP